MIIRGETPMHSGPEGSPGPGKRRRGGLAQVLGLTVLAFAAARLAKPRRTTGTDPGKKQRDGSKAARGSSLEGRHRGRHAATPAEIPAQGWRDILLRVYNEVGEDRILMIAAGATFYVLLAIFPALAAFVSLYGLVADPATISDHIGLLSSVLPGGALDVITEQINRLVSQGRSELGLKLAFGLAISLWSANAGMKALFDALNICYEETEKRSFVRLNLQALLFTLLAIASGVVAILVVVVLPVALQLIGLETAQTILVSVLRWPLIVAGMMLALAVLYRYGPSRETARWRWVTWGSAAATVLWLIVSIAFSYYVSRFGNYDATYGSLGAVIGFMTWIWLSTAIVLVGAELNAEMERQTVRDTTTGPELPMGQRKAVVADTVAPAPSGG